MKQRERQQERQRQRQGIGSVLLVWQREQVKQQVKQLRWTQEDGQLRLWAAQPAAEKKWEPPLESRQRTWLESRLTARQSARQMRKESTMRLFSQASWVVLQSASPERQEEKARRVAQWQELQRQTRQQLWWEEEQGQQLGQQLEQQWSSCLSRLVCSDSLPCARRLEARCVVMPQSALRTVHWST